MDPYIKVSEKDKVATVEFFHPKSNSLDSKLLSELALQIENLGKRRDLNVIALKSAGKVFCAGASFNELVGISDLKQGEQFFLGFAKVIFAIKSAGPIVVTRIQGKAVGGSVGIIAASDYAIASDKAEVRLSELSIGIGPFVISPVIKSKITNASFMHMALNPSLWFGALWCVQNKLINESCSNAELDSSFEQKLKELASYSTEAIQALKAEEKSQYLEGEMQRLAIVSGELVTSEQTKKILKTFIER